MKTKEKKGFRVDDIPFLLTRIDWKEARIAELEAALARIAFANCTCDSWENSTDIDTANHDQYCMYRVIYGRAEETP